MMRTGLQLYLQKAIASVDRHLWFTPLAISLRELFLSTCAASLCVQDE